MCVCERERECGCVLPVRRVLPLPRTQTSQLKCTWPCALTCVYTRTHLPSEPASHTPAYAPPPSQMLVGAASFSHPFFAPHSGTQERGGQPPTPAWYSPETRPGPEKAMSGGTVWSLPPSGLCCQGGEPGRGGGWLLCDGRWSSEYKTLFQSQRSLLTLPTVISVDSFVSFNWP